MSYVVQQGDYLAKIARDHGIGDWRTIWEAPENADLRALRKNPNILFPGDRVVLHSPDVKQEPGATEQRHRFELDRPRLKLVILLEDAFRRPVANANCELQIESQVKQVQTDAHGRIEESFPPGGQHARLVIRDKDTLFKDAVLDLEVGRLDPVDTLSGQMGRLMNMGYLSVPSSEPEDSAFLSAVEEFQCDHDLLVDGICGPTTQAKLRRVHGC